MVVGNVVSHYYECFVSIALREDATIIFKYHPTKVVSITKSVDGPPNRTSQTRDSMTFIVPVTLRIRDKLELIFLQSFERLNRLRRPSTLLYHLQHSGYLSVLSYVLYDSLHKCNSIRFVPFFIIVFHIDLLSIQVQLRSCKNVLLISN